MLCIYAFEHKVKFLDKMTTQVQMLSYIIGLCCRVTIQCVSSIICKKWSVPMALTRNCCSVFGRLHLKLLISSKYRQTKDRLLTWVDDGKHNQDVYLCDIYYS